jgi:hypothetical protein
MFEAVESFLFDSSNQLSIANKSRSRVTVISVYAKNDHLELKVKLTV